MDHSIHAVVLDLSANGIGIIRSLYKRGIEVHAFDVKKKYQIGKTRYARCKPCPDPSREELQLVSFLMELGQRLQMRAVIYAGSDEFVLFLSKHREVLTKHYRFIMPKHSLIEAVLDKRLTAELAETHAIKSPKTYVINDHTLLDQITHDIQFPCILKPVYGHEYRKKLSKKAIIMESASQLKKELPIYQQFGELMIQEVIPGADDCIYQVGTLFDDNMELIGLFMGQKLNQFPPYFGAGALVKSVRDEEVIKEGVSFLKSLKMKGISVAEFKRDPRDGQLKFIEINARTWLWHSLSGRCGVDLSYLYYLMVTNQNPEKQLMQEEGIKWIFLVRDYLSTMEKMKNGDVSLSEWWRNVKGMKENALFRWDDPLPFFRSTISHLVNTYKSKRKLKKMNTE